jgi:hypothetical protein
LTVILPTLRTFIGDPKSKVKSVPEFMRAAPVVFDDPLLELLPEAYLESRLIDDAELIDRLDSMLRETAASIIRFRSG